MDATRFDELARFFSTETHRRILLRTAAGLGAGIAATRMADVSAGTRKGKGKGKDPRKPLCRENGSKCNKKSSTCKSRNCLSAPFSIEAQWAGINRNYNTYFFVPQQAGNPQPSPFISPSDTSTAAAAFTGSTSPAQE